VRSAASWMSTPSQDISSERPHSHSRPFGVLAAVPQALEIEDKLSPLGTRRHANRGRDTRRSVATRRSRQKRSRCAVSLPRSLLRASPSRAPSVDDIGGSRLRLSESDHIPVERTATHALRNHPRMSTCATPSMRVVSPVSACSSSVSRSSVSELNALRTGSTSDFRSHAGSS
jgi:hypothetical protein